jgi:hypothetical protein
MLHHVRTDPHGQGTRRRRAGRRLAAVLSIVLTASSVAQAADGEDARDGFAVFGVAAPHVVVQRSRGSVGSNFDFSSRKSNILTNLTFRLGGGVKGPAIEAIPGRPRPVLSAAALIPINESATIGTQFIETNRPGFEQVEFSKFAIEYQPSALATLGLEFLVPVFDSEISITPAIQSLHLTTRYVGEMSFQINASGATQLIELRGKKEITQHYLGPAIRLGTPAFVAPGGIVIDFFLESSLLVDVAGTRETFSRSNQDGDRVKFNFEAGGGVVQVGTGVQIRWP